jgi:hypothetical protein
VVGGLPEMVGGPAEATVIVKAGKDAEAWPSLTLMTIPG